MKLTVVGCSPAWPNPGGAQSGYLVESDVGSALLDCGPGVLARLLTASAWPEAEAIVITHFHLDHFGDLVPWVWGAVHRRGMGYEVPRPQLWVPPDGRAQLARFGELLGFVDMFDPVFAVTEYAPGVEFVAGGLEVTATPVPHYRSAAHAFRVSGGGRTLAYSGDSAPSEALARCAEAADLFVCEATLGADEADGVPRGHLSLEEAQQAFEASGAAALLVTHRPVELETPPELSLATDGMVVSL